MTKIVHEFCGICIQGRDQPAVLTGVWGGGRLVDRGTSYLRAKCRLRRLRSETRLRAQRSALRLFFAPRFARLRGIARWWRGGAAAFTHSPPVRRRVDRGTSSLGAPAVFASRFARLRGIAAQTKKRQPSRATAAGRHAPFPVSYTIRLPAGSICARNIIPWFCPLRKYKKWDGPVRRTFSLFF